MHLHREKAVADAEFYRVRALAFAAPGPTPRTSVLSPHGPLHRMMLFVWGLDVDLLVVAWVVVVA